MPILTSLPRTAIAVSGGMALFNWIQLTQAGPLASEIPGDTGYWTSPHGRVFYKRIGEGDPLLLLHGFNAGASSYEMRRLVAPLAKHFQVYALDWLGFGLSDRPRLRYTAALYLGLLDGFLREVVQAPAHVIASSLAGAYVVQHAGQHPDLYRRLVLIAPTGIESLVNPPSQAQQMLRAILVTPLLGEFLFNLLVTPASLNYFLQRQGYYDPDSITPDVVGAYFAASHQPGARYAPAAFISGDLNLPIREAWSTLPHPTLLAWGRDAITTPVSNARPFMSLRPQTQLEIFERCRLLPHDEYADRFTRLALEFLRIDTE